MKDIKLPLPLGEAISLPKSTLECIERFSPSEMAERLVKKLGRNKAMEISENILENHTVNAKDAQNWMEVISIIPGVKVIKKSVQMKDKLSDVHEEDMEAYLKRLDEVERAENFAETIVPELEDMFDVKLVNVDSYKIVNRTNNKWINYFPQKGRLNSKSTGWITILKDENELETIKELLK